MLDFRDKKRSTNNRTAPGKKKESAGEESLDSSPGTLLFLDR